MPKDADSKIITLPLEKRRALDIVRDITGVVVPEPLQLPASARGDRWCAAELEFSTRDDRFVPDKKANLINETEAHDFMVVKARIKVVNNNRDQEHYVVEVSARTLSLAEHVIGKLVRHEEIDWRTSNVNPAW